MKNEPKVKTEREAGLNRAEGPRASLREWLWGGGGEEDSVPARAQSTSTADGMWARGRTVARSSVPTSPRSYSKCRAQRARKQLSCGRSGLGGFLCRATFFFPRRKGTKSLLFFVGLTRRWRQGNFRASEWWTYLSSFCSCTWLKPTSKVKNENKTPLKHKDNKTCMSYLMDALVAPYGAVQRFLWMNVDPY